MAILCEGRREATYLHSGTTECEGLWNGPRAGRSRMMGSIMFAPGTLTLGVRTDAFLHFAGQVGLPGVAIDEVRRASDAPRSQGVEKIISAARGRSDA